MIVQNYQKALQDLSISEHIEGIHLWMRAEAIEYPHSPETPRHFMRRYSFEDAHLVELSDVMVCPNTGICWIAANRKVFRQSVGMQSTYFSKFSELCKIGFATDRRKNIAIAVAAPHTTNAWHFFMEDAPSLIEVSQRVHGITVLTNQIRLPFFNEALNLIFQGKAEIAERAHDTHCSKFWFGSREPEPEFARPAAARLVREFFLNRMVELAYPLGDRNTRIYVSRRGTSRRAIANEKELEALLSSYGFRVLELGELTLLEQIESFRSASTVVGLHGAGLTHMLWARECCRVIEILPTITLNNCYSSLAFALGFHYSQVSCELDNECSFGRAPLGEIEKLVCADLLT